MLQENERPMALRRVGVELVLCHESLEGTPDAAEEKFVRGL